MQKYIPNFKVCRVLENINDTLETMLKHKNLIQYSQSCIGPYRYRQYLRKNNQEKYGVKLRETQCGSCWKCCLEYCVFTDKGIYEYNAEYYKHCLQVLRRTLKQETGTNHSLDEVWEHFFFYDKSKSKYFSCVAEKCVV